MRIGEQIAILREHRNISQKELAEHLGIHNSVLNRIELGSRPLRDDELARIAYFFNVSADYLLGLTNDPHGHTFAGQTGKDFLNFAGQVSPEDDIKGKLLKVKESSAQYDKPRTSVNLTEYFHQQKAKKLLDGYAKASDDVRKIVDFALGLSESKQKSHPEG